MDSDDRVENDDGSWNVIGLTTRNIEDKEWRGSRSYNETGSTKKYLKVEIRDKRRQKRKAIRKKRNVKKKNMT